MGITIPEKDGGVGGTLMDAVIAIEQVALVCPRSADVVQFGNFGPIRTFAEYATPAQKQRWLPALLSGGAVISLGMSEPAAGSAVTELTTSAKQDGNHYVINGSKVFSTFSPDAKVFLVYVRYGRGLDGIGSVLVERDTPGFTVGAPSSFMSGEEWSELHFENCRIPAENVLLGPGGFKKQIASFNVERLGNSARSLALGRYAYNTARDYCTTREQFGRPLCEFQGLQWKFADMAIKLEVGAAPALPRRRECRPRAAVGLRDRGGEGRLQPGRLRGRARGGAGDGRARLQPRGAGRILHAALPRLDDRGRLDRDAQEPDRRTRLRPTLRPATATQGGSGGVNMTMLRRALFAPTLGRDRRAIDRRHEDRRAAAEIPAPDGLRRTHLSHQSGPRHGAGRARLAVACRAAGSRRTTPIS